MPATFTCPCRGDHTTIEHLGRIVKLLRLDATDGSISWVEEAQSAPNSKAMEENLLVLKSLASTYDSHIRAIRERGEAPRFTPEILPDETITQIFEHIDYDVHSLAKFSHISARVRRVILHAPSLWAKLPLDAHLRVDAIAHIARYSGTLGLTAIIQLDSVYSNQEEKLITTAAVLEEIFKHGHRWTRAEFNVAHQWASYIESQFADAELNSLRTLSLEDESWDLLPFYGGWSMPQLNSLRSVNDIPNALHAPATKTLTKCSFEVSGSKVTQMLKFLASTPNLAILMVHLTELTDSDSGLKHKVRKVNLPLLEYLEYTSSYPAYGAVRHLFKCVACPNLKRLSYISHFGEGGFDSYIDFSGHIRERYPSLESFELAFNVGRKYEDKEITLEDILCSLPATVEKVRLDISTASLRTMSVSKGESARKSSSYPNLKDLDLEACTLIPEDGFYTNLSNCLGRLGVTLQRFRPSKHLSKEEAEIENAMRGALDTLRKEGVLVDSDS